MPLDISDEQLLADADKIGQTGLMLDNDGWSNTTRYVSATWSRLRYVLGVFREEVLEFPFRPLTVENKARLMQVIESYHTT